MHYLLQYFTYKDLPENQRKVALQFHDLAVNIYDTIPRNRQAIASLEKLLESRDCALRAVAHE